MYAWIWRHLPGRMPVKVAQAALLVAVLCALLLFVIFPWIEPHLPFTHVTVNQ
jgi:hypothetical protein